MDDEARCAPADESGAAPATSEVSDEELATCVRVLRALTTPSGGISDAFREPRCKQLRSAMHLYVRDARDDSTQAPDPLRVLT